MVTSQLVTLEWRARGITFCSQPVPFAELEMPNRSSSICVAQGFKLALRRKPFLTTTNTNNPISTHSSEKAKA